MQMERVMLLTLLTFFAVACGRNKDSDDELCRPRDIVLAECLVKEYENNPTPILIEQQRRYCENLYPFNMCYYP